MNKDQFESSRFVMIYGEPFMKVTPVDSLMRSKTISTALANGSWFAVNMNTGALTIVSKDRQVKAFEAQAEPSVFKQAASTNPDQGHFEVVQRDKHISSASIVFLENKQALVDKFCWPRYHNFRIKNLATKRDYTIDFITSSYRYNFNALRDLF